MAREKYPNLQEKEDYYPSRVRPKLEMVEGWARNGLSDEQIATNLGIALSTFRNHQRLYEELRDTLRRGREDAQIIVENAFFKRAVGYNYTEITKERRKNEDGEYELVVTKKVRKHVMGDTSAQIYWLEHRAPHRWEKNPQQIVNPEQFNEAILNLASLLKVPVEERKIGCEEDA